MKKPHLRRFKGEDVKMKKRKESHRGSLKKVHSKKGDRYVKKTLTRYGFTCRVT